jgi:hypothetical protein
MSLSDEIEVRIAGNLCRPVTLITRDGTTLAMTVIAASPIALVGARMDSTPVKLTLEVHGAANAAAFAARAGVDSRVILRGTLTQRSTTDCAELARADGGGTVAARFTRHAYVVVVERLLYVTSPSSSVQEAS